MDRSGINQQRLAEAVGCTQSDISRYKTGRIPGGDKLVTLAHVLGCTAESLLTEQNELYVRETPIIHVSNERKDAQRALRSAARKLREEADRLDSEAMKLDNGR